MSRGSSPNSMTYEIEQGSPIVNGSQNNICCIKNGLYNDDILSQLKVEAFEKDQNRKSYEFLQQRYAQLQGDLDLVRQMKCQYEKDLKNLNLEERNKAISDLKNENENLLNELNEKIANNKKLYSENNNLFRELEARTATNEELEEKVARQEEILNKLTIDKNNLERRIFELTQLNTQNSTDIQNMNNQVTLLKNENCELENNICNAKKVNCSLINEINTEKKINNNLVIELRNKENDVCVSQKQLTCLNENLHRLENDCHNISEDNKRIQNDICNLNNEISNNFNIRTNLENNNQKLKNIISDKELQIQNFTNENNNLNACVSSLDCENAKLNTYFQEYKRHLLVLNTQNNQLSQELRFLLNRDKELRNILDRDNHLQAVRDQNDQLLKNSLETLQGFMEQPCINTKIITANFNNSFVRNSASPISENVRIEQPFQLQQSFVSENRPQRDIMSSLESINVRGEGEEKKNDKVV